MRNKLGGGGDFRGHLPYGLASLFILWEIIKVSCWFGKQGVIWAQLVEVIREALSGGEGTIWRVAFYADIVVIAESGTMFHKDLSPLWRPQGHIYFIPQL